MNIRGLVRLVGAAAISLVLSISTVGSVAADGMVTPPALAYTIPENSSLLVPNSAMLVGQPAGVYVQTTDLTTFPPDWGKITGGATGITYVPQTDYVGHDAFSYTVCKPVSDGQPTCLTAMVTITINAPVGTPVPTASPSGGVGAATGKPRVTPPTTSLETPGQPRGDNAALLVLAGIAAGIAGTLLLVPTGRRGTRRR